MRTFSTRHAADDAAVAGKGTRDMGLEDIDLGKWQTVYTAETTYTPVDPETPAERVARLKRELADAEAEAERAKRTYGQAVAGKMLDVSAASPEYVRVLNAAGQHAVSFRPHYWSPAQAKDRLAEVIAAAVDAAYAKGAEDQRERGLQAIAGLNPACHELRTYKDAYFDAKNAAANAIRNAK